ncbi:MAG: hypothetical protein JXB45_11820 [Candidatus Krumholzibacteriota bacterium]|nr:hypothetical protein [Candidatus Krumholzibacteriota bacterium]
MRKIIISCAVLLFLLNLGCSRVSMVERESFQAPEAREAYVKSHPDGAYCQHICNGEIVRGMNGHEVLASWGLPNLYLVSDKKPEEYWVYYTADINANAMLIYTLTFNDMDQLHDWDIDIKRFVNQGFAMEPSKILSSLKEESSISRKR